jgi:hypothetical protein
MDGKKQKLDPFDALESMIQNLPQFRELIIKNKQQWDLHSKTSIGRSLAHDLIQYISLYGENLEEYFITFRFLQDQGVDLNLPDEEGITPFMYAISCELYDVARHLFDLGVRPTNVDSDLATAIVCGDLKAVDKLVDKLSLNHEGNLFEGTTRGHPIFWAILANRLNVVQYFVKSQGICLSDELTVPSHYRGNFYEIAVSWNRLEIVQWLVTKAGVSPYIVPDANGQTLLWLLGHSKLSLHPEGEVHKSLLSLTCSDCLDLRNYHVGNLTCKLVSKLIPLHPQSFVVGAFPKTIDLSHNPRITEFYQLAKAIPNASPQLERLILSGVPPKAWNQLRKAERDLNQQGRNFKLICEFPTLLTITSFYIVTYFKSY